MPSAPPLPLRALTAPRGPLGRRVIPAPSTQTLRTPHPVEDKVSLQRPVRPFPTSPHSGPGLPTALPPGSPPAAHPARPSPSDFLSPVRAGALAALPPPGLLRWTM